MEVLPVRLPGSLPEAVAWVARRESVDRSTALRKLLASRLDRYVTNTYARAEVSLREAAVWLGLPVSETLDRLADDGTGWTRVWPALPGPPA